MTSQNITVIATIKAREGREQDVREKLEKLLMPTRAEPGCMLYELYQSAENRNLFMFYECWQGKQDLDTHLQKPYIKAFMQSAEKLLADPVDISLWKKIGENE